MRIILSILLLSVCYTSDCTQSTDGCGHVTNNCWVAIECSGTPPSSASVGYFENCTQCSGSSCECYSGYTAISGAACSSSGTQPPFDTNITYDTLEANPDPLLE